MKHTNPGAFLNRSVLCFVRDQHPTPEEFIARFGEQGYHLLRKEKLIVPDGEKLRLNRRHLSPDGLRFTLGNRNIHLDDDIVEIVRLGRGGPRVYAEEP